GSTVSLVTYGSPSPIQLETSTDGTTWTSYTINDTITLTNVGDYVMFRGNNNRFNANGKCYEFAMNGSIAASGKVTSLYDSTCQSDTIPSDYMFGYLFYNCTALTHAPELPATNLRDKCYIDMFYGCTGLTYAPELPATTMADDCYSTMFRGCSSLVQAPDLPATSLADRCYSNMFRGCTSLNYIKCLATNISSPGCTGNWVSNVSATGTFVKDASMNDWTTGNNGIPSGWTIQNAS
ncbi:MAG: hypothetical protein IIY21_26215, partial [Clostridiales bacterium]|nr:hypothetical protein [Clostridiales bacterium]